MTARLLRRAAVAPDVEVTLAVEGGRLVDPADVAADDAVDLEGRPVLAGLVDQHLHVRALAASWWSVDLSPGALGEGGLAAALVGARARTPDGWLRGVGYDPATSGPLDRAALDAAGVGPVRVQDRTGTTWTLDSAGLAHVLPGDPRAWPDGVETDAAGAATGRLVRLDGWLRTRIGVAPLDLVAVGRWLAGRGVTTLVDASVTNGAAELEHLAGAGLGQRLVAMTGEAGVVAPPGIELGPLKVVLDDVALPALAELEASIALAHGHGRAVAVHCVTTAQLVLALAAGLGPGDRVEHGSVVPDDVVGLLAERGPTVVTQPGLVRTRGDRYLAEVEAHEVDALYRLAGLRRAGVPVAVGTDAPYGPADPWVHVAAAVDRTTAGGVPVGVDEAVDLATATSLLQRDPLAPHGPPRALVPGTAADLCVLDVGWSELAADPAAAVVHSTWVDGEVVA